MLIVNTQVSYAKPMQVHKKAMQVQKVYAGDCSVCDIRAT
jgi:hypothetical protein